MSADSLRLHATCVSLNGHGILLRGPSGSGKSDLALRLIAETGARLVADDHCILTREAGALIARPAPPIAGRIEARGMGLLRLPYADSANVSLLVDLSPPASPERLPDPAYEEILGVSIPRSALDPLTAGTVAKLRLALRHPGAATIDADDRPVAPGSGPNNGEREADVARGEGHTGEQSPPRRGSASEGALRVIVVTGMSGAGRSTMLKALEDVGYEAIDNLPLDLLPSLVHDGGLDTPIALGVDIRTRDFAVQPFTKALSALRRDPSLSVTLVFLDCEDEVLQRRYTETRRRHPLAQGRPLSDGIAAERRLVAPLRHGADLTIDTSTLSVNDLRRVAAAQLGLSDGPEMVVFVTSFSYKAGLPREADLVFDARFLANPHYQDRLRPLTGRDRDVADYVAADPDFDAFFETLTRMLARLIPRYESEGKSYLTVAVGCTGGRHRSVAIAEKLAEALRRQGRRIILNHRDLVPEDETKDAAGRDSR